MTQLPVDNLTCQLCCGGDQLPDLVPVARLTSYLSHQNVLEGLLVDIPSKLTDETVPKLWFKLSTCSNPSTENSEHFLLCDNCSSELQTVDNLTNELESIQKRIECQVLKINEIRQGSSTLTVSPGQVTISGWTSGQDNIWRGWEALGSILEGTLPRLTGRSVENGGESSIETVLEETGNQSQEPEELSMVCEVDEDYMPEFKTDSNVSNPTVVNSQGHFSTDKDNNEASSSSPAEVVHVTTPKTEELHSCVITSPSQQNLDETSSSSKCRTKRINSGPAPLSVKCKRTKVAERKFARKNRNLIQLVQKRALTVKLERLRASLLSSSAGPRKFDYFYARGKESRDYKCPHCGEIIKGHCNLGAHLFQQHLDRRPHVCDICNWPFTTRNTLRGHKRVHSEERRYKCKLCGASFKWSFCFKKHLKSCKNKSQHKKIGNYKAIFKCQHCDFTVKKKADLKKHYLKEHSDLRPYSCQICNWPFATLQYLEIHQWVHNKETPGLKPAPVILKECHVPMQTSIVKSAKKPKVINKTAKCQYCAFTAEAKDNEQHWQLLSPHYREQHLDKRPFLCQVCPRTFLKRKQLKEHQLKHSALKTNELKVKLCEICDKTFAQSSYLNRHINSVHLNSKPLECVFCLSTFARKDKFDLHLMGHIGEKPFSCDLCTSAFKEERILRIHKQTHAWVKPFKCNICLRSYVSKDGLKNHVCRGN